jgi:hypothetical protein
VLLPRLWRINYCGVGLDARLGELSAGGEGGTSGIEMLFKWLEMDNFVVLDLIKTKPGSLTEVRDDRE